MARAAAGDPPPDDNEGSGVTADDVQRMIREALAGAAPPAAASTRAPTAAAQQADVTTQVEREVARIAEREKAATDRKALDERLAAIEEKAKQIPNEAPKQFRRITQALWGDR